jgi:hypothetical protein
MKSLFQLVFVVALLAILTPTVEAARCCRTKKCRTLSRTVRVERTRDCKPACEEKSCCGSRNLLSVNRSRTVNVSRCVGGRCQVPQAASAVEGSPAAAPVADPNAAPPVDGGNLSSP